MQCINEKGDLVVIGKWLYDYMKPKYGSKVTRFYYHAGSILGLYND